MLTNSFLRAGHERLVELAYHDLQQHRWKTQGWPTMNVRSVFAAMHEKTIRQFQHELSESSIVSALIQSHKALRRSIRASPFTLPENAFGDTIGLSVRAKMLLIEAWTICLVHGVHTKILRSGPEPSPFRVLDGSHQKYSQYIADHDFIEKAQEHQNGAMINMPVPDQDAEVEMLDQQYLDLVDHGPLEHIVGPIGYTPDDTRSDVTAVEPLSESGDRYGFVNVPDVPTLIIAPQPELLRRKCHRFRDTTIRGQVKTTLTEGLAWWYLYRLTTKSEQDSGVHSTGRKMILTEGLAWMHLYRLATRPTQDMREYYE